uniref:Uncharacterized protein n=1 Tax=Fagus sylvatica TaxID=28930 RepID=A0A2N9E9S3_FAGSY
MRSYFTQSPRSVLSSFGLKDTGWASVKVGNAGVVVVAWGWASVSVGNAGVVVVAWGWASVLVGNAGVVVGLAWCSGETHGVVFRRETHGVNMNMDPRRGVPERPTAVFSDLDPPRPATTKERPTAWLSSQICPDRGQPPPRREARTTVVGSDLHGGFWLLRFGGGWSEIWWFGGGGWEGIVCQLVIFVGNNDKGE